MSLSVKQEYLWYFPYKINRNKIKRERVQSTWLIMASKRCASHIPQVSLFQSEDSTVIICSLSQVCVTVPPWPG